MAWLAANQSGLQWLATSKGLTAQCPHLKIGGTVTKNYNILSGLRRAREALARQRAGLRRLARIASQGSHVAVCLGHPLFLTPDELYARNMKPRYDNDPGNSSTRPAGAAKLGEYDLWTEKTSNESQQCWLGLVGMSILPWSWWGVLHSPEPETPSNIFPPSIQPFAAYCLALSGMAPELDIYTEIIIPGIMEMSGEGPEDEMNELCDRARREMVTR
ncbi:hypothetical protein C8J56DRAFT_893196 [Mycena floridula]|nr:hypothetical protein C8J56DRAFT_893196 [Mycena floridula]